MEGNVEKNTKSCKNRQIFANKILSKTISFGKLFFTYCIVSYYFMEIWKMNSFRFEFRIEGEAENGHGMPKQCQ